MSIAIQKNLFGFDRFIGDTRQKLLHLYHKNPDTFNREILILIEYWCHYDGLEDILAEKLEPFKSWCFNRATPPNTISRCHRALKEDGSIPVSSKEQDDRREQESQWRNYFGNEKKLARGSDNSDEW